MDNFRLDVTSQGKLEPVLSLFRWKTTHISTDGNRLRLAWTKPSAKGEWSKLPYTLNSADVAPLVEGWLKNEAKYGTQPDHDGDNGKGWRVYNEAWGHVDRDYAIFVAVEPVWAMYGK